jgi:hypothetical protein
MDGEKQLQSTGQTWPTQWGMGGQGKVGEGGAPVA